MTVKGHTERFIDIFLVEQSVIADKETSDMQFQLDVDIT